MKQGLSNLHAELEKAWTEAEQQKSSAQKNAELLTEAQKTCEATRVRVAVVKGDL